MIEAKELPSGNWIKSIQDLRLQPGDVFTLQTDENISEERMKEWIARCFPGVRILFFEECYGMGVVDRIGWM